MMKKFICYPYLHLIRFDRPVGSLLLMLPCWWGVLAHRQEEMPFMILLLFALGAFLMRSAGCILNDMADRSIDRQVERTRSRPLAAGTISMKKAVLFLILLLSGSLIIALLLGWKIALLGSCFLPLVALYPYMKRITYWPQAFLGITFGSGGLFGSVAMTGNITATALWIYAASICWVIGYDTIYACQDIEDDSRIGVKSTARYFGSSIKNWLYGFFSVTSLLLLMAILSSPDYQVTNLAALFVVTIGWLYQLQRFDQTNPARCLQQFKQQGIIGGVICVAFI